MSRRGAAAQVYPPDDLFDAVDDCDEEAERARTAARHARDAAEQAAAEDEDARVGLAVISSGGRADARSRVGHPNDERWINKKGPLKGQPELVARLGHLRPEAKLQHKHTLKIRPAKPRVLVARYSTPSADLIEDRHNVLSTAANIPNPAPPRLMLYQRRLVDGWNFYIGDYTPPEKR
jgi:hypothetical protein